MARSRIGLAIGLWMVLPGSLQPAQAQGGITQEGDATVLRTGSDTWLLSHVLELTVPEAAREPSLHFEFGFATEEPTLPDSFFDSFSVTLQPADASKTALLLTIDTTGLVRAPDNPGGLTLTAAALDLQSVTFPDLSPTLDLQSAFTVSFNLPGDLTGAPATLFFDLFDNLNSLASLAYVRDVRIDALPPIGQPANLQVWSSRSLLGPYVEQTPLEIDLENRTLRFVPGDPQNFFLLDSPVRARILNLGADSADWILTYAFDPVTLFLESAVQVAGPYAAEETATVDILQQTLRVPAPDATRFYRVRSEAAITLSAPRWEGGTLRFDYTLPPMSVALLSGTKPTGPYLPEPAAREDTATRTLRLPRDGSIRFFQLTADRALRIRTLSREDGRVTLTFDQP